MLLTEGLQTQVLLTQPQHLKMTRLFLLDGNGEPLANHGGAPDCGGPLLPIPVAGVPDDPAGLISIALEPVPGTSVGMAGSAAVPLEAAAEYLVRHYRPALDPSAEPWQWDTPWHEAAAFE
ncbi:hypothetical protein AB0K02_23425 [Streptomyces sp. NPDC049597]|uniref:hypothetical protein n=1 Tax=Streptomyces sp. NPDC049597 TaxID=3155276 RepID=UPI00344155E9